MVWIVCVRSCMHYFCLCNLLPPLPIYQICWKALFPPSRIGNWKRSKSFVLCMYIYVHSLFLSVHGICWRLGTWYPPPVKNWGLKMAWIVCAPFVQTLFSGTSPQSSLSPVVVRKGKGWGGEEVGKLEKNGKREGEVRIRTMGLRRGKNERLKIWEGCWGMRKRKGWN